MAQELAKPWPVRIGHQRLNAREIGRKALDEPGHLACEEWKHQEQEGDDAEGQEQDEGQGGQGSIDPEPLQRADDRGQEVRQRHPDHEGQQNVAQQDQQHEGR